MCITLAFIIRWYFALVAVALLAALVAYIESRHVQVDWGSALGGIRLDLATAAMLDLAHERRHSSNWRPQLLCLPSWPLNDTGMYASPLFGAGGGAGRGGRGGGGGTGKRGKGGEGVRNIGTGRSDLFLGVASQLKKGRGLCVVAEVVEGDLARERGLSMRVRAARAALEARLYDASVRGFAHVIVASSYCAGKSFAIQALGFGGLEPNTVLLAWPHRHDEDLDDDGDEDEDERESGKEKEKAKQMKEVEEAVRQEASRDKAARVLVETVCECTASEKAVLLCLGLEAFPSSDERVEGFVDVWWMVHDGGLLLMIAHLLLRHKTWAGCKLRVHTVLQSAQDPAAVRRSLQKVLQDFRIDAAEVSVVEAGVDTDMYAYTHDWTMRNDQAEQFRDALLNAGRPDYGNGDNNNAIDDNIYGDGEGSDESDDKYDGKTEDNVYMGHSSGEAGSFTVSDGAASPGVVCKPGDDFFPPLFPPMRVPSPAALGMLTGSPRHSIVSDRNSAIESPDRRRASAGRSSAPSPLGAFPCEIDMLVAEHGELETPDALKLRHQRRLILADSTVQTKGIVRHASLASIFDMNGISAPMATPPRLEHDHYRAVGDAGAGAVETAKEADEATAAAAAGVEDADESEQYEHTAGVEIETVAIEAVVSSEDFRVTIEELAGGSDEARLNNIHAGGGVAPTSTMQMQQGQVVGEVAEGGRRSTLWPSLQRLLQWQARETKRMVTRAASQQQQQRQQQQQQQKREQQRPASWVMDKAGPMALNRIIHAKSADAQLVIINLPDPDAVVMQNPSAYAQYTEALVKGLPRVIFVHGTGREVYTSVQ